MKEQVRAWATEVWQTSHWTNEQIKRLERFYSLVRNAALAEALNSYSPDDTAADFLEKLEDLKEPT